MVYQIALKIGSSHTSIFRQGDGIVLYEPTLVSYTGAGKNRQIKAVGAKSKNYYGRSAEDIVTMSPVFEGVIVDSDLAIAMLKNFIGKLFPRRVFKPRIRAIVCVPIGITLPERKCFERVCFASGIQDVVLVPSVITGAIGYNIPINSPSGRLVVNIGGGSTDIAAISLGGIISGANLGVGGEHMDVAVQKYILDKYHLIISKSQAEKIKKEAGSLYANDTISAEISGVDVDTKASRTDVIESVDIYAAVEHYYANIAEAINGVLAACPADIIADINNNGIFLMGGGAEITGVEQYFRKKLDKKIIMQDTTNAIDVIGAGKLLSDQKLLNQIIDNL